MNRHEFVPDFEKAAVTYAGQLVSLNPVHEPKLIRILVGAGKTNDAVRYLKETPETGRAELRAAALLEVVRSSSSRDHVLSTAMQELYSLISRHPQNPELRFCYADLLLFAREYRMAEQVVESLRTVTSDGRIDARRAWILAVQEQDLAEAQELAEAATRADSLETGFREVQARVFLARNEFEQAFQVLRAVPQRRLSLAGQTYLATALLNLDRMSEARAVLDQIRARNDADVLFPADEDLLKSITPQILQPATARR
jgi:thioredoxin-like negative regulator of GroEL